MTLCFTCEGHGYHVSDNGPAPAEQRCEDCDGTGEGPEPIDIPIQAPCPHYLAAYLAEDPTPFYAMLKERNK